MACDFIRSSACTCWKKHRRRNEAEKRTAIRKGIKIIEQARVRRELSAWEANQIVMTLEQQAIVPAETSE